MKIKLKKAIAYRGEELNELDYTLDDLTANDLIEVDKQVQATENISYVPETNRIYLISIAARALKMPVEVLREMSARDFSIITNDVLSFLLGLGSYAPTETPKNDSAISLEE